MRLPSPEQILRDNTIYYKLMYNPKNDTQNYPLSIDQNYQIGLGSGNVIFNLPINIE